jgi:hypothetical protein
MQLKTTITRDDVEIPVTVELTYYGGCRGHRDRYGAPEEPDEPATFEVDNAVDAKGFEYDLTDAEYDEIVEKAGEQRQENEGPQD